MSPLIGIFQHFHFWTQYTTYNSICCSPSSNDQMLSFSTIFPLASNFLLEQLVMMYFAV